MLQRAINIMLDKGLFGPLLHSIKLDTFFQVVEMRMETRGKQDTIQWIKSKRLNLFTFLAGNVIQQDFIATDKDGLGVAFTALAPLIKVGNKDAIRLAMTILQVGRVIEAWKDVDLTTVTEGPSFDPEVLSGFNTFVKYKCPRFLRSIVRPWKSPHLTNKMGPMGRAIQTSVQELFYLPDKLKSAIYRLGGSSLKEYKTYLTHELSQGTQIVPGVKESRKGLLRRLSIVNDTEGKSRVIAIGDYWSQTALRPLHDALLKALSGWGESDVTFGQSIAPFGHPDHKYHSFDLSAATDRIPKELYSEVINHAYGKESYEAWKDIMTRLPFDYQGESICYSTGQPKGQYSSWTLLAHTHHQLVRYSAALVGLQGFGDYRILGDDVVIRNDLVAASYLSVKTSLGIGISKEKTLVSDDTFEFAKRFFYQGEEVTGYPVSSLNSSDWLNFQNTTRVAIERGYSVLTKMDPNFIYPMLRNLSNDQENKAKGSSFYNRQVRKVLTQAIARFGIYDHSTKFTKLGNLWNKPVTCNNIESFVEELNKSLHKEIKNDLDSYVAKAMSISYELDRDKMIPRQEGTTGSTSWEYQLPQTLALNESVNLQQEDSQTQNELMDKASNEGIELISVILEWSESHDLRSFDPRVLDTSRKAEAASHKSSTQLIRTLSKQ